MPNPFYAAYWAGAEVAGCEPVYVSATAETDFLPDLDSLERGPARPHGRVLSRHAIQSAGRDCRSPTTSRGSRRWRGVMASWCLPTNAIAKSTTPAWRRPARWKRPDADFANVVVFHSLSKRSNLPGLRVGFAAGDKRFLARFLDLRNVAAPQVPIPAQRVAIAAYEDEAHVEENRRLYAQKFDLADQIIGNRYGYRRPPGGFFLWLDVSAQGGSEAATLRLWREAGVRVVPGNISRATSPTAAILAPTTSASPWCTTTPPRPRRCIASSRCWADGRGDVDHRAHLRLQPAFGSSARGDPPPAAGNASGLA